MELKAEVQLKTNCSSLSASSWAERSTCNGLQAGCGSDQSMGSPPYLSRQTGAVSANSFGKQHHVCEFAITMAHLYSNDEALPG